MSTKNRLSDIFGMIFLVAGAGMIIRSACFVASQDIWFDELFTVELALHPMTELIRLAARDVHPPLYYILVRIVYWLLHGMCNLDVITAAKITSILPYAGVIAIALTVIRKRFGWLGCGLTIFCITAMPQLSAYIVEARMYSLCAFVILAMYIHAEERQFIPVFIYGVCALYLHYYSAIAAVFIVIYLITGVILEERRSIDKSTMASVFKEKGQFFSLHNTLFQCILFTALGILAYIPWVRNMNAQAGSVRGGYWIQPLTIRTIPGCIKYIFKPDFTFGFVNVLIAILLFAGYVVLLIGFIRDRMRAEAGTAGLPEDIRFIAGTMIIPVCTVLTGVIASLVIRPVFVYRYMVPVLFLFWMGYACLISECFRRNPEGAFRVAAVVISVLIMCTGMRSFMMFAGEEQRKSAGMQRTGAILDALQGVYGGEIICCNFNQIQSLMWYYTDCDVCLWGETDETLIADICDRSPLVSTTDTAVLADYVRDHGCESFLFFGSFNARDEILDQWEDAGFSSELIYDSCFLERYYFNIYLVSLNSDSEAIE